MRFRLYGLSAALILSPLVAFAHSGHDETSTFTSGLMHPLFGMDHLLAMIAVGLIAGLVSGRMIWALPVTFLASMLMGAIIGLNGFAIAGAEMWILASVILLGAALAVPREKLASSLLMAMTAGFAFFHGYAHGVEAPSTGSASLYMLGFVISTAALLSIGVLAGKALPAFILRLAGLMIAGSGLLLESF